jgi:ParB-like chromosome segregation protein Spo0J
MMSTTPTPRPQPVRGDALPPVDPRIYDLLKRDIQRRGRVIVPVITDEAGRVLDGKLRLAIAEQLGIRDVPRIKLLGLTEAQKKEARVVFNLARRQLSRAEIQALIEWELTLNPTHSDRRVAGKIGASPTTVGKIRARVQVGHVDRVGRDDKVYKQPAVYTQTDRQHRQASDLLDALRETPTDGYLSLRKLRTLRHEQDQRDERKKLPGDAACDDVVIHCRDFRRLGDLIPPASVRLGIIDPPWDKWRELGAALAETVTRLLQPNGVLALYPGTQYDDEWNDAMKHAGLVKYWRVISLHREPGTVLNHGAVRHMYTQIILYRWKPAGPFVSNPTLPDVIECRGPEKQYDKWQQPLADSVALIRCLTKPGDVVMDLCAGTGTVALATVEVGDRRFVGCEISEELAKTAMGRVRKLLRSGGEDDT